MAGPMPSPETSSANPMTVMAMASRPKSSGSSRRASRMPVVKLSAVCPKTRKKFQMTALMVRCLWESGMSQRQIGRAGRL